MSDKLPAQRVIEAARKLADAGTVENDDEMVAAVRAYEASADPGVVVSGAWLDFARAVLQRVVDEPNECHAVDASEVLDALETTR